MGDPAAPGLSAVRLSISHLGTIDVCAGTRWAHHPGSLDHCSLHSCILSLWEVHLGT